MIVHYPYFILCLGVAGFGALMVLLIRFLASVIVWFIITIAIIGSIGEFLVVTKIVLILNYYLYLIRFSLYGKYYISQYMYDKVEYML